MTDLFAGLNGSDAWNGKTWDTRKATIGSLIAAPHASGDRLYVGPGTYREGVALKKGGALVTTLNTVTVTEGSRIVTGAGNTNWDPAVHVGDRFLVKYLASGLDGATPGAAAGFTTATSTPFLASIIGFCINIWNPGGVQGGSYLIDTFVGTASITLTDVNGIGWMVALGNLTYYVPSNEGTYEIASVDSETQITLDRPWSGPTYAGLSYRITRPVYLIGDNTGAHTDGVGGIVRITGSDNDQSATRGYCIRGDTKNYWVIKGFQVDTTVDVGSNNGQIELEDCTNVTIEDITSLNTYSRHIYLEDNCDVIDIRRCALMGGDDGSIGVDIQRNTASRDDWVHIENVYAHCNTAFQIDDFGAVTIKNCMGGMSGEFFLKTTDAGWQVGQSCFVHDCEIHYCSDTGLDAAALGQIVGNFNNFWGNATDNANVVIAAPASNTEYMYNCDAPILRDGYRYPVRFFVPNEWWSGRALLGLYGANQDMYGALGPITKSKRSYGPFLDQYITRNTTIVYAGEDGALVHPDARTTQFRVPINGAAITMTVWVYLGAGYAGVAPKLIVHQEGNTDVEATATGTTGAWEQLSVGYTPNVQPLVLWVELVSDNTGGAVNVYWQHLQGSS